MNKYELLQLAPENKDLSLDFVNHTLISFYNFDNSLIYNSAYSDNVSFSNSDFKFFIKIKHGLVYHILVSPRYINANFDYSILKDELKISIKVFEDSKLNKKISADFLSVMKNQKIFIFNEQIKKDLLSLSNIFLKYKNSNKLIDSVWNLNTVEDNIDTFVLLNDM